MAVGLRSITLPVAAITVATRVSITNSSSSASGPRYSKSSVKPPLSVPEILASVVIVVRFPRRSDERSSVWTILIFVTTLPSKSGHFGPNISWRDLDVCVVRTVAWSASSALEPLDDSLKYPKPACPGPAGIVPWLGDWAARAPSAAFVVERTWRSRLRLNARSRAAGRCPTSRSRRFGLSFPCSSSPTIATAESAWLCGIRGRGTHHCLAFVRPRGR